MSKRYFVYILSNKFNTVFYVGITNDVSKRVWEHKEKFIKGFTERYNINKLLYYEEYPNVYDAIAREKQLKKYKREWKLNLIKAINPTLEDQYYNMF